MRRSWFGVAAAGAMAATTIGMACLDASVPRASAAETERWRREDTTVGALQKRIEEGRQTFRFDTFGDEAFWGGTLRLHEAIAGAAHGGVGPGLSARRRRSAVGLKVDADALPAALVDSDSGAARSTSTIPATTLALLQARTRSSA